MLVTNISFITHEAFDSIKENFTICANLNSLPNDTIWALTKMKAIAGDKFNVAKMLISLYDRIENIVEKGENAGYQHFLLFPQCFQKASFSGSSKVITVW